jgi:large subunit ribosomal protein L15
MSILSNLKPPAGAKRKRNRVGRGPGSGNGKTCGRGQKGQGSRSGSGGMAYFEGGQMPLYRRVPKRGFYNLHETTVANVNVGQLDQFEDGAEVTVAALRERGLVKGHFDAVKVLGDGQLEKKLTVKAHGFSKSAAAKIEKAGGKAEVVSRHAPKKASEESAQAAPAPASADEASSE